MRGFSRSVAVEAQANRLPNLAANAFEALDGQGRSRFRRRTTTIEADPAFAGLHPPSTSAARLTPAPGSA
jgi:hypothetical protein